MHRFRRGPPLGRRVVGLHQADGMPHEPQRARSVSRRPLRSLGVKHLTHNQMFGSRQTAGPSPRPESLPVYISSYINGYGRPWTSSDPNPRISPVHGQIACGSGALPATTDHMVDQFDVRVGPFDVGQR
jgi:hypothetical protein